MAWTTQQVCDYGAMADVCVEELPDAEGKIEFICPKCGKAYRFHIENFDDTLPPILVRAVSKIGNNAHDRNTPIDRRRVCP